MNTTAATQTTKCPASGRTAKWCLDQTHAACYAAQRASVALDRRMERQMSKMDRSY